MEPMSARAMSEMLLSREVSSAELLDNTLATLGAREPEIRAFITQSDEDDLKSSATRIDQARARGETMPEFAGVPIAIKDNIAVKGQRLTCGSEILASYVTPFSATAVQRLEAADVLVIGKTNMDEFGFGSSTENSAFFPTRNPRSLDRVPGGSSGGSAAAVAADIVPWALGTDTGGSVRQPASLCGVVGFRPSYGAVSRYGLVAYSSSMDQIGPMARNVDDALSLFELIAGSDPCDSTTLTPPPSDSSREDRQLRLGVPAEYLGAACAPEIRDAVLNAARTAEGLGWTVEDVSLPMTDHALSAYYVIASVEAASNLERYDGVGYGYRSVHAAAWSEMLLATRTEGFGAEARRRIMLGTYASSAGYEDKYYATACKVRTLLIQEYASVFANVDVILSPVSPTTAWPLGERLSDPMAMYLSDVYSVPAALAGIPALVIPASTDSDGLPIGVQLCGPHHHDHMVLDAGRTLETALTVPVQS
jgi:aspartyl-tRNA(Asn)/glutamyl-tRNA(Gln) amidotransferase subunit A